MNKSLMNEIAVEEEVTHFCAEPRAYYAVTCSGRMLMIKDACLLYTEISDEEDYHVYMCIEAHEGFFLLRQHIRNKTASSWFLEKQLIPFNAQNFLARFKESFLHNLQKTQTQGDSFHA